MAKSEPLVKRPTWDEYFMQMAELTAQRSTCLRRHVGAVIVTAKEKYAIDICHKLRNLGYRHVYNPSENGSITLSLKNGKLKIQVEG